MNMKIRMLLMATGVMAMVAKAETLVWYHFDEAASGTVTTAGCVITNAVAPAATPTLYCGVPMVNDCTGNSSPKTNQTNATYMPRYAQSLGHDYTWYDPVSGEHGTIDRSLYFNSNNGYTPSSLVKIDGSEELTLTTFTVEMFFRTDGITSNVWRDFFMRENQNKYSKESLLLRIQTSVSAAIYNRESETPTSTSVTSHNKGWHPDEGNWHHLAMVLDGANKTLKLYIDYELISSANNAVTPTYLQEGDYDAMTIGSTFLSNYGCFKGWIDEFRLSNSALEPQQFLQLKSNQAIANSDADTYCYLPMNCNTNWFGMTSETPFRSAFFNEAAVSNPPTVAMCGNGSFPLPDGDAEVKAGAIMRGSVTNEDLANYSSLHFVTNAGNRKSAVIECLERTGGGPLARNSFTTEFFVKFDGRPFGNINYLLCQVSKWSDETPAGGNWGIVYPNNGNLYAFYSDERTKSTWKQIGDYVPISAGDTAWHHFAYVYDREKSIVRFYVDYRLHGSASAVLMHGTSTYVNGFTIAGGYATGAYQLHGWMDDVRVTTRVLSPQEFLSRSSKVNGNTIFWADFEDGTLAAKPYPVETIGGGSAWTSGGAVPKAESTRWARHGLEDGNGGVVRETNAKQLGVNGGCVDFGRILALEGEREFTIEAAVKLTSADANAGIIRLDCMTGDSETAGTPLLAIAVDETGKHPLVRADTTAAANQTNAFTSVDLTDGHWHPIALTVAADGENTKVALYDGRVKVGEFTVNGKIDIRNSRLSVGRGTGLDSTGSAGVVGALDELRITRGALAPTDMLGAISFGMLLMLK